MTSVFFVRHAQPDISWADDRTRPLTALGVSDREAVTAVLSQYAVDTFVSSPYKRSFDTVKPAAEAFGLDIKTDERFRERRQGENPASFREIQWSDFTVCEPGGECLASVKSRCIAALQDVLRMHSDGTIVVSTHGKALSVILNHYDPSFAYEGYMGIRDCMPYIIRLDFDGGTPILKEELLRIERGY